MSAMIVALRLGDPWHASEALARTETKTAGNDERKGRLCEREEPEAHHCCPLALQARLAGPATTAGDGRS